MPGHSRRSFLVTAGTGAAVGAGALLAPAGAGQRAASADDADTAQGSIVAYVKNPTTGQVTVMAGDREVEFTDVALARALARKVV